MPRKTMLVTAVLVLIGLIGGAEVYAQGPQPRAPLVPNSVFTYQGQLKSGGTPYTGSCGFQFGLWNASTLGTQIGVTQTVPSVPVTNGLFTAPLDFGLTAFDGTPRYLQIGVRCPAGSGIYTLLASRQQLTAAPMALYAERAGTVSNLPSGSASYIQNTNTQQSGANFNISGSGTLGGALYLPKTMYSGAGVINLGGNRFLHNYGSNNTFLGSNAGNLTMTGGSNTGVGSTALLHNTVGYENTAVGIYALTVNTEGSDNTAIGTSALKLNSTGTSNTAVGANALFENSTGNKNTAVGTIALQSNFKAENNTAVGFAALTTNYDGHDNTALGVNALLANIGGSDNAAVGVDALKSNITGYDNAAFGREALYSNTDGIANTSIGRAALYSLTTGGGNTAIGWDALAQLTTGGGNIALGMTAAYGYTAGEHDNIVIGNYGTAGDTNTIRIGSNSHTRAFISGIYGKTSANGITVYINSSGQLGTVQSSQRFKDNIRDMGKTSDILYQLHPVNFTYKPEYGGSADQPQVGLIAEQVAAVAPWMVVNDEKGQPYTVRYEMLAPMLLNELQKQQATMASQDKQIRSQASEIGELRSQVASLRQENANTARRLSALETTLGQGGPALARNGLEGLGTPVWVLVGMLGLLVGQRAWKGMRP